MCVLNMDAWSMCSGVRSPCVNELRACDLFIVCVPVYIGFCMWAAWKRSMWGAWPRKWADAVTLRDALACVSPRFCQSVFFPGVSACRSLTRIWPRYRAQNGSLGLETGGHTGRVTCLTPGRRCLGGASTRGTRWCRRIVRETSGSGWFWNLKSEKWRRATRLTRVKRPFPPSSNRRTSAPTDRTARDWRCANREFHALSEETFTPEIGQGLGVVCTHLVQNRVLPDFRAALKSGTRIFSAGCKHMGRRGLMRPFRW